MASEQAFPSSATEVGGGSIITTPFQFVADPDTFLRVVSVCSVAGVVLAVQGRRLDNLGQLQAITETHTPLATRTTLRQDYGLGAGAILNLTIFAAQGAPLMGQCYVMVQLLRNFGGTAVVLGTLLGGYVSSTQALGFPGSPIVSSTSGEAVIRNIIGTTPAPGAFITETCPAGARWELVTIFNQLVTSAAAALRLPFIEITSGGNLLVALQPSIGQNASMTFFYTWAQNLAVLLSGANLAQSPIPQRQFLRAGDQFLINAVSLQAGDQFGPPQYQVRELLEVA